MHVATSCKTFAEAMLKGKISRAGHKDQTHSIWLPEVPQDNRGELREPLEHNVCVCTELMTTDI